MAATDKRNFGTDLTNVVQNRKSKGRLTKKADKPDIINPPKILESSKEKVKHPPTPKSDLKSKTPRSAERSRKTTSTRLAQLSLNEIKNLVHSQEGIHTSSTPHIELPYRKIRTYSKKPGKEWVYIENADRHRVTFANEPLDIEAWLTKEQQKRRQSKKL